MTQELAGSKSSRQPVHGTETEYRKYRCRCEECRKAQRLSLAAYRAAKRAASQ